MTYQFCIIGLGTAGAYAAWRLAEKGHSVIALDRKPGPGSALRSTGGISDYWMKEANILDSIPDSVIGSWLYGFKVTSPNMDYYHFRSKKPIGVVMYQDRFEKWLCEQAEKAGAKLVFSAEAFDYEYYNDVIRIDYRLKGEEVVVDCMKCIIADGPRSVMGRKTGLAQDIPKDDMHLGMEFVFDNDGAFPTDEFELDFTKRYAPLGYRWYFPEGQFGKIGNGVPISMGSPRKYLNNYINDMHYEHLWDNRDSDMAGQIPTAKPYKRVVSSDGRIAIIGDAARTVIAVTGGGIHLALVGAYKVAEFSTDLQKYQQYYHKSGMYRLLNNAYKIKRMMYKFTDDDFNKMVRAIKSVNIEDLMHDRPQRAMFKLVRRTFWKNPAMFLKVLPGMLR